MTNVAESEDPNSLLGPAGYGSSNFVALNGAAFPYQIDFENAPTATAPAQAVTITDQLDPNLNWSTFQLTGIRWGDTILSIPAGSQHFQATVPMTYNGQTFDVDVEAGIHTATGQVYATFQSIDPNTDLPPDVLTGFLPPENGTGRGMGYVSFMVQPNVGLATGTADPQRGPGHVRPQPGIATDQVNDEDPSQGIDPTKQALVTIDSGPPTSSVSPLPATTTSSSFTVNWSGQDDPGGSGIASYDVYVSDDGGPFTLWQSDTTATSATFAGQVGHTYGFYSVATDNVGNVQATPPRPRRRPRSSRLSIYSIAAVSRRAEHARRLCQRHPQPARRLGAFGPRPDPDRQRRPQPDHRRRLHHPRLRLDLLDQRPLRPDHRRGLLHPDRQRRRHPRPRRQHGHGLASTSWLMDTTPPTSTVDFALDADHIHQLHRLCHRHRPERGQRQHALRGCLDRHLRLDQRRVVRAFHHRHARRPVGHLHGQAGNTYGFYSIATDNAGNVQPTPAAAQQTVQILTPMTVTSIAAVSPNPRNTSVSSLDVTFSQPINTTSLTSAP